MQSDKSKALIDSIALSINTLATMTDRTAKLELFKTWLRAVSRFHHYSFLCQAQHKRTNTSTGKAIAGTT